MLEVTESITANIFHLINHLAVEAVETGREQISDEVVENWRPELDMEAAFALKPELPHSCQLPIILPLVTDELLSSWIHRHAVLYGVPPLVMLRHCLVDVASLRAIDLRLTDEQASRRAHVFRTEASGVRRMSLSNISPNVVH
jgi:hypothetical protein